MRKWKVFDNSKRRLALYSSLISHFRRFRKYRKSMPKINGKLSKIRPGGDQWPLIRRFLSFWNDAKEHVFLNGFPWTNILGKIGPSGGQEPIQGQRVELEVSIFGNQGPREPPFSRAQANRKRAKGKQETRNKPKKGSNTPIGRWPGELLFV